MRDLQKEGAAALPLDVCLHAGVLFGHVPARTQNPTATPTTGQEVSRPSRGFSASPRVGGPAPVCPTSGATSINQFAADDWFIDYTWSPDVNVTTFSQWYQVNGGGWNFDQPRANVSSGVEIEVDPNDFAGSGDFLEFKAVCNDVGGCPDFETAPAGAFVA